MTASPRQPYGTLQLVLESPSAIHGRTGSLPIFSPLAGGAASIPGNASTHSANDEHTARIDAVLHRRSAIAIFALSVHLMGRRFGVVDRIVWNLQHELRVARLAWAG